MAKIKISALSELADGSIAVGDYIPIVDVSDTSQASSGTTKKVTITSLASGVASAFTNNDNPTFQTLTTTGAATIGTTLGSGAITSTGAITGTSLATSSNGALNIGTGTITSGLINGQTISSTANFTGTVGVVGDTTLSNGRLSSSYAGGSALRVYGQGTHQWDIYTNSANLRIGDNTGSGYVRIDANTFQNGKIGIGVDSFGYDLQLYADSAAKPTSNTWTVSSDVRIKENIELANLQTCFENVKNLKLKRFTYKQEVFSNEQVKDRTQLGFIAQEVEPIFPKAITKNDLKFNQKYEDVIIPAKFNENGIEIEKERIEKKLISEEVIEDCLGLDSSQIIWALYGAVQHLIAKVEALENK